HQPPPPVTVALSPRAVSVTFTQPPQSFIATVLHASDTSVTWTVDGVLNGNATVGTITTAGLYTAPTVVGSHTIVATSVADPSKSASATIYITDYAGTFTYHNDNARTGQDLAETVLSPANVAPTTFGKLFSLPVDGYVYAQPLYVANLDMGALGVHNVVFVATEHDSVYAFDADNRVSSPLWHTSFINGASVTTVPSADVASNDIVPEVGITGTPVIDPAAQLIYVVAKTKESGQYVQRLHALDLTTGAERLGGPVALAASVPGSGDGDDGAGNVPFNSLRQLQRSALLLDHGVVYIAFASHSDNDPYHGWVLAYDAATLAPVSALNVTPDGARAGIWHAGGGPAADAAGNVYISTGNGTFDAASGGADYGDSVLRLAGSSLVPSDYFTPFNQATLEAADKDLGSGGPMLLPDQSVGPAHLLLLGGKEGRLYLLDRDNLGHFHAGDDSQIPQSLLGAVGRVFGTPAYFNGSVYFHSTDDVLKAFALSNGRLPSSATSQSNTNSTFPGCIPVVSADASVNAIVWELNVTGFSTNSSAVLHAYDATNVARELYNTTQNPSRDAAGPAVKFTVPTVANGKVYVGTQNAVNVYGLLP
ncbi:MAG TPA: hypothetical protein VL382_06540, partial [Terriglobales bacterium]|nr:hypothetical protein [Terriglobales bacterium]